MYRSKCAVFRQQFFFKIARKLSIYKALLHFCVIITRASTRRTIPVAPQGHFLRALSYIFLLFRRGRCPHRPAGGHRPVAVPCVRLGDGAPALHTDRGHRDALSADFVGCALHAACGPCRSGRFICHRQRSHRSPTIILQITLRVCKLTEIIPQDLHFEIAT